MFGDAWIYDKTTVFTNPSYSTVLVHFKNLHCIRAYQYEDAMQNQVVGVIIYIISIHVSMHLYYYQST
jgi:hypothetical protein